MIMRSNEFITYKGKKSYIEESKTYVPPLIEKRLVIDDANLESIEYIERLESLTELDSLLISSNRIRGISGLNSLKSLNKLGISAMEEIVKSEITEIKGLENQKKLWELNLRDNQITKLGGLSKLESLQELDLTSNYLEDVSWFISQRELPKLHTVYVWFNKIPENQLEQLSRSYTISPE